MKVLHLNLRGLGGGGSAMATRRLHFGLRKAGVDSRIICSENPDEPSGISVLQRSRIERRLNPLLRGITSRLGLNYALDLGSGSLKRNKVYLDADIVSINNFTAFFSYLALPSLSKQKPTVLVLHDMWPYTGHCFASFDCDRWKSGCGKCPYPETFPRIKRDATNIDWRLKDWAYRHSNLTVVTLSTEQTNKVKQSMLRRFPIYRIPHGVDTECYRPLDSQDCRSLLGISPKKNVLMFMAKTLSSNLKGSHLLRDTIEHLPESLKRESVLLLVGNKGKALADSIGIETLDMGFLTNDRLKAICYAASDLFVYPTRADTFPLVLLESIACGTPIVSFRIGGVPDVVRPGVTGYLAQKEDTQDLADGIVQLLEDGRLRQPMREQCRAIALQEYSVELQVQRYISLYRQILTGSTQTSTDLGVSCRETRQESSSQPDIPLCH